MAVLADKITTLWNTHCFYALLFISTAGALVVITTSSHNSLMGIHYPVHSNILLKIGATSSFDGIFPLQDIKSKLPKNMKMSFLSLELKLSQTHHSPSHKCLGIYYARNVTCICVPLWLLPICSLIKHHGYHGCITPPAFLLNGICLCSQKTALRGHLLQTNTHFFPCWQ